MNISSTLNQFKTTFSNPKLASNNTTNQGSALKTLNNDCVQFSGKTQDKPIDIIADSHIVVTKADGPINSIRTTSSVNLIQGATVLNDVIADGSVIMDQGSQVGGNVLAEGSILINRGSVVQGGVQSVKRSVEVTGKGTIVKQDVIAKERAEVTYGAVVEGDLISTENGVLVHGKDAIVKGDAVGSYVSINHGGVVEGEIDAEMKEHEFFNK
ncbi:MAG: polymer-forming cytoskeletal protein [Vampirovibrionia bacterium]